MSEIDVLSLARKHGLIPEEELPKFPVERFIDYPDLLEELQAFADEVAKLAAAEAQALLKDKDEAIAESLYLTGSHTMLEARPILVKALAQTSGTDALDKMLEAEREACAAICDRFGERNMHPNECASAIRAIP